MTVRPIVPEDHEQLARWMQDDPDHRHLNVAEFLAQPNCDYMAFEDELGVVFFARFSKVLRLDTQFSKDKLRTARMLREALPWVMGNAQESGYREVIFNSVFAPLVRFMSRLGFRKLGDEFSRWV